MFSFLRNKHEWCDFIFVISDDLAADYSGLVLSLRVNYVVGGRSTPALSHPMLMVVNSSQSPSSLHFRLLRVEQVKDLIFENYRFLCQCILGRRWCRGGCCSCGQRSFITVILLGFENVDRSGEADIIWVKKLLSPGKFDSAFASRLLGTISIIGRESKVGARLGLI